MSRHVLASLSALALTLGLAQGMAQADLSDAESALAFKALTRRVTEAQRIVGANDASKASMLRQLRGAREHLGSVRSVVVNGGETSVYGSNGHINLKLPVVGIGGHPQDGYLRSSVNLPGEKDAPRQQLNAVHSIGSDGVVHRKLGVDAFTADGMKPLGAVRASQRGFPSAALSPRRR